MQVAAQTIRHKQFSHWIDVIVILQRKSFSAVTIIESLRARRVVSSCCSASKSRNTHSSPWPSIHQHQCGPTTEDYHTVGSQTLMTWKLTNSQQAGQSGGKPTGRNSHLARTACLRKRGRKSCLAPEHRKRCSVPWGGDGAERRQSEPDADKFRDLRCRYIWANHRSAHGRFVTKRFSSRWCWQTGTQSVHNPFLILVVPEPKSQREHLNFPRNFKKHDWIQRSCMLQSQLLGLLKS